MTSDKRDPALSLWETNVSTGLTNRPAKFFQVELYVISVQSEDTGEVVYDFKSKNGFSRFTQIVGKRSKSFPPGTYRIQTRCIPGPSDISSAAEARAIDIFELRVFLERDVYVQLIPSTNGIYGCHVDVRGFNRVTSKEAHVSYELQ